MKTAILHRLAFGFDRARNALVFQGLLEDGYQFEVVFPIGHVAMVFDAEASTLGHRGAPLLGAVETVDAFLQAVEVLDGNGIELGWFGSKLAKSVSHAVSSVGKAAYNATIKKVANTAVSVARAGVNIAKGQNVLRSVGGVVRTATADLKVVGQYAGTVPGIGTGIGALASGANAALSGKSLTDIAKATAVGAVPGGPLAQAAVSAAVNLTQKGIEGHNMVKAAAGELINAAASMAPPATQAMIRQTAMAAISGNNILSAAQHAAIQTALAQVPDANARSLLTHLASGQANAASLVHAAGGELAAKMITAAPSGAVARMLNQGAAIAPATPHFIAIGAHGLAAAAAGYRAARLASAPATPNNVANLARLRTNVSAMLRSGHPQAALITAGLQSAKLHAA